MKVLDFRCKKPSCGYIFEEWIERPTKETPPCPMCDCTDTEVVFIHPPNTPVRSEPYDKLRKGMPEDPIKVYMNDKRTAKKDKKRKALY